MRLRRDEADDAFAVDIGRLSIDMDRDGGEVREIPGLDEVAHGGLDRGWAAIGRCNWPEVRRS